MYPRPAFFSGARLNFAQNLLYPPVDIDAASPAIIAATETTRETVSWAALRSRVEACQRSLKTLGIKENDRVAGYVGNHVNGVVAMLAATSLGAVYTGVSPDSGVQMVTDRLAQIEPRVLFADDGQFYNGKTFGVLEKLRGIVKAVGSVEMVVVFDVVGGDVGELKADLKGESKVIEYEAFLGLGEDKGEGLEFVQLPPDHPVYILYSSGTTGMFRLAQKHDKLRTRHNQLHIASFSALNSSATKSLELTETYRSPKVHRARRHRYADTAQKGAHPPLLNRARPARLLLHNSNLDDVALAHLRPRRGRHNRPLRRLTNALPSTHQQQFVQHRHLYFHPQRPRDAPPPFRTIHSPLRHLGQIPLDTRAKIPLPPPGTPQHRPYEPPRNLQHRLPPRPLHLPLHLPRLPSLHKPRLHNRRNRHNLPLRGLMPPPSRPRGPSPMHRPRHGHPSMDRRRPPRHPSRLRRRPRLRESLPLPTRRLLGRRRRQKIPSELL